MDERRIEERAKRASLQLDVVVDQDDERERCVLDTNVGGGSEP